MTTYGSCEFFRKLMFCAMASAVPRYQFPSSPVKDGVNRNIPPCLRPKSHHLEELRCSFRLLELNWVRTATFCTLEYSMFVNAKSMLRKLPATGIAQTARFLDSSFIRLDLPPARIIPIALIPRLPPCSEFGRFRACRPDNPPLWSFRSPSHSYQLKPRKESPHPPRPR